MTEGIVFDAPPLSESKEHFNPFAMAQAQLDTAARILQLDPAIHALLREPLREM